MPKKQIPIDAIVDLRRRLDQLPPRSPSRRVLVQEIAQLYGISEDTVYRTLREGNGIRPVRRADCDVPRVIPKATLERYCEIIAAIKIRTSNRKGRHLSTVQAIRLLEEDGINTPDGHVTVPVGLLKPTTVNRYLNKWGYDRNTLLRQPPAVRFQAEQSNQCWHFDLSPSDLKHVKTPAFIEPGRGHPLLMLYSVVDDRSGVAYQEYHAVYGEDVEAALRFMFAAMSPKKETDFPFQGIPQMLYMDNGPIAKSLVFQKVMGYLGIEVRTHLPNGKDGRRVTARSKGKVERPFRTVKEMHETLYHLHEPETEAEANAWLMKFLLHYNSRPHRSEPHSRVDEAHDIHHSTLVKIKRLIELVRQSGCTLSVVLLGHPKLKNDLRRPSLEEIGARTNIFSLEGIRGHQVEYIKWLLSECIYDDYLPEDLITDEAIAFLAERLTTPLQIEHYLQRAFEDAYQAATKPVTPDLAEAVLNVGLNDLEPRLIRHGYTSKVLAELLNIRVSEVNSFIHAQLPPGRTQDLRDQMLKMGIPLYASEGS